VTSTGRPETPAAQGHGSVFGCSRASISRRRVNSASFCGPFGSARQSTANPRISGRWIAGGGIAAVQWSEITNRTPAPMRP
jgi:hypothetical protein